jgi:predicted DNA-binding transcriptional regulator AlpA
MNTLIELPDPEDNSGPGKKFTFNPDDRGRGSRFFPARWVWERYGITSMTLYRWILDERMNFPKPVYFGRFRYWRISDLEAWERVRISDSNAGGSV